MDIEEFKATLKPYMPLIGFDFGTKRLGVAVSDPMRSIATPLMIIRRENFAADMAVIRKIIAERGIGALVYGLPLQMDGSEGKTADLVRSFAQKADDVLHLPYFFWDERYSSSAVEGFLVKEADFSRQKRKNILDASAAAYILQGVLDRLRYIG